MLLRDVVQRAAQQAVQQQVARATAAASEDADDDAPPPLPCQVGFVFALGIESGGTEDLLTDTEHLRGDGFRILSGQLDGRGVALIKTGVGRQAAAQGALALIAGHRPRWIISAGLAGGLHPDLARGDVLLAESIVASDGSRFVLGEHSCDLVDELRVAMQRNNAEKKAIPRIAAGQLLTVDRAIRLPAEKLALGRQHGALAVDMETLAVAEVCCRERVPFFSVRVISDSVHDELPAEIEKLLEQKTAARRAGAALGAILNRPGSLSDMLKLKEQALIASDQLARVLKAFVEVLAERHSRMKFEQNSGAE